MGFKQGVLKKQTSSSRNNIKNVEANEKNEIKNPDLKMVGKCCATDCKFNHLSEKEKVNKTTSRGSIADSPNTVLCVKHFPPGFPVLKIKGKSKRPTISL